VHLWSRCEIERVDDSISRTATFPVGATPTCIPDHTFDDCETLREIRVPKCNVMGTGLDASGTVSQRTHRLFPIIFLFSLLLFYYVGHTSSVYHTAVGRLITMGDIEPPKPPPSASSLYTWLSNAQ